MNVGRFLGLNGAGKSTLLKLLMSEYWASSGQVTVLGTRFGEGGIPELRKRIGIVSSFISERLPEHLLTEQNCPNWSIQEQYFICCIRGGRTELGTGYANFNWG